MSQRGARFEPIYSLTRSSDVALPTEYNSPHPLLLGFKQEAANRWLDMLLPVSWTDFFFFFNGLVLSFSNVAVGQMQIVKSLVET